MDQKIADRINPNPSSNAGGTRQAPVAKRAYSKLAALRYYPFADLVKPVKRKLIKTVQPDSLLGYQALSTMYDLASELKRKGIRGNFVECGVCNGGLSGLISSILLEDPDRSAWLFDSWEGLPEPKQLDVTPEGTKGAKGLALGSLDRVKSLLYGRLHLDEKRIHLIKGWFEQTLSPTKEKIGPIAFMHLDGDWYDSIKICLDELYDQVVSGGIICIDDYECWLGCKKAVDEFVARCQIKPALKTVPFSTTYLIKP